MASYATAAGFNGDALTLPVVVKTLNAKSYIKPGVNSNPDLTVSVGGESVQYYVRDGLFVAEGTIGAKHTIPTTGSGFKAKTFAFTKSQNIDVVIPYAADANTKVAVTADKMVEGTMQALNNINEDFISTIMVAAKANVATTAWDAAYPYLSMLQLRSEFITTNKKWFMKPTCFMVAPDIYAALLNQKLLVFKGGEDFASFADIPVLEIPDMDAGYVVIMNDLAAYAAANVRTIVAADSTPVGFPGGTLYSGEIGYLNGITELPKEFTGKLILSMKKAA
jgi:hypothetical protein